MTVLYFNQHLGACSTQKLVELLLSAVFNLFSSFPTFFSNFMPEINIKNTQSTNFFAPFWCQNSLKKIGTTFSQIGPWEPSGLNLENLIFFVDVSLFALSLSFIVQSFAQCIVCVNIYSMQKDWQLNALCMFWCKTYSM